MKALNALGARVAVPYDRAGLNWMRDHEWMLQIFRLHFKNAPEKM
jgi:hypothetical protein